VDHVLRHRRPRRRATALLAGLVAALLAASMSPARAEAPTPTAKALTLAAPGVVQVLVRAKVSVRLHRSVRSQVDLGPYTYSTRALTGGSGMVVAPDWVVTASHVVDFDEQVKDVARVYAANRLFLQLLRLDTSNGAPPDKQLYGEQRFGDPFVDSLLQQCYNEDLCKFDVRPDVSVIAPVQVGGARPKRLPAQVRANTHFDGGDVAALQLIDADPLATVPLATTAGDLQPGQSIVAMGYPASHTKILPNGTTEPSSSFGHVSNVTSDGSTQVIEVDIRAESGASGGPAIDDQGKVVGMVSYTGLDETGGRTQLYLQTADNIRSVLREAGVQPTRAELDTAFAEAMEYYWAGHYSAALPQFQKVLDLQDGHILARKYLRLAQAKAGGPEDVALPSSAAAAKGGFPMVWALVALAVLVVVALLLGALAWRRRRRAAAGLAYPPASADTGRVVLEPWDDVDRQPPVLDHDAEPAPAVDPGEVAANSQPAPRPAAVMVQDAEPQARGFCPYCGTRLVPEARFCSGCGRPQ
jgi:S1-C subfamily serine protease